ncbi:hypothetical protein D3C87_1712420 [compost metagenome]
MRAVNCQKVSLFVNDTQVFGKCYNTAPAIAAHAARAAIGIEIKHLKIIIRVRGQKHESICTNTKTPVAKLFNAFIINIFDWARPMINENEVVSGTLVFEEFYIHFGDMLVFNIF